MGGPYSDTVDFTREEMTTFDFFEAAELPVPAVSAEQAAQIAANHFGLSASVSPLGSQRNANFLLSTSTGEPIGVLKIANPAFSRAELRPGRGGGIDAAEEIRTATNINGSSIVEIDAGGNHFARIIRFLPGAGSNLAGDGYVRPAQVAALGDLAGRTCRALAAFDHQRRPVLQWDLRHGLRTVKRLASHVTDPHRRGPCSPPRPPPGG